MEGYAAREASPEKTLEDYEPEYDRFLKEVDEYISLLRRCFTNKGGLVRSVIKISNLVKNFGKFRALDGNI